jgi:hypothetical protein
MVTGFARIASAMRCQFSETGRSEGNWKDPYSQEMGWSCEEDNIKEGVTIKL